MHRLLDYLVFYLQAAEDIVMPKTSAIMIAALSLSGCAYTSREVVDPPTITVQQAMNDVGEGLAILRSKTGGQYGLIADEVTVVFNVSSKATSNGKLGITAQNIPISGGLLGGNASAELANESNRGNTITIKLKNIATAEMKGDRTLVENCTRRGDCSGIFNVPAPSAPPVPK